MPEEARASSGISCLTYKLAICVRYGKWCQYWHHLPYL